MTLVVEQREIVARDVVRLVLRDAEGKPLPPWQPGAHLEIDLPGSLVRHYSLCGDLSDVDRYEIAVLDQAEGRGGSRHIVRNVAPGSMLDVSEPRLLFKLVPAPRYLFIAGGIGITPILPMIQAAEAAGADWRLLYGGRDRQSMAFVDRLQKYGDQVTLAPQDESGLLDLKSWLETPVQGMQVYCCGPESLLQAVERGTAHWPRGSLHVERFAPKPMDDRMSESFEIELRQSGTILQVLEDRSILETIEDAGISTLSSCGQGTCGTCLTMVLKGTPDHRDSLLDNEEREAGDKMLICVSRSKSKRLVLDL
ncbi:ferredoxin [Sphingomonas sp. Root710]|uniref:PDR/VanB family oxidoreductase n=1 Tax=Sphingomonas sp. Root710 TaxID=1736594 RepID=UPI0006FA4EE9|nr:PDR/VanB family oxidoreductase [Sphingomonas sp. Root710]KRB83065.1 ferredoxin [Sphingomonas sp. Root710]